MSDSVMIGYIHPSTVHVDFMHSLLRTIFYDMGHERHLNNPGGWVNQHSGPNVAGARNQLTTMFLGGKADWLLMLDTDIAFPASMVQLMVDQAHVLDATVLSGLYWGARQRPDGPGLMTFPVAYAADPDNETKLSALGEIPDAPVVVAGAGAGCLLVHRSALEAVRDAKFSEAFPFFQETEYDGEPMSEDLEFCLRLARVGHKTWFTPSIEVGHMKDLPLIRELMDKPLITMKTHDSSLDGLPPKAKKAKGRKR